MKKPLLTLANAKASMVSDWSKKEKIMFWERRPANKVKTVKQLWSIGRVTLPNNEGIIEFVASIDISLNTAEPCFLEKFAEQLHGHAKNASLLDVIICHSPAHHTSPFNIKFCQVAENRFALVCNGCELRIAFPRIFNVLELLDYLVAQKGHQISKDICSSSTLDRARQYITQAS